MKKLIFVFSLFLVMLVKIPIVGQERVSLDEQKDMVFLLEEEKMARDVYLVLGEKWDHQVFKNISEAEQRHLDLIKDIAKTRALIIPEVAELNISGKFQNPAIQKLYDELELKGQASLIEAFKVGAWIEERDIEDLNLALDNTDDEQLILAYSQLKDASENHLRAFSKNLGKRGVEYTPQILSADTYLKILSTEDKATQIGKNKAMKKCCKSSKGKQNCCKTGKMKKAGCKSDS